MCGLSKVKKILYGVITSVLAAGVVILGIFGIKVAKVKKDDGCIDAYIKENSKKSVKITNRSSEIFAKADENLKSVDEYIYEETIPCKINTSKEHIIKVLCRCYVYTTTTDAGLVGIVEEASEDIYCR